MTCFSAMDQMGHEELIFCRMKEVGLEAVIAIHDTTLGPALGGTRMWPYVSEEEAIVDALRLSAKLQAYRSWPSNFDPVAVWGVPQGLVPLENRRTIERGTHLFYQIK